MAILPIVTCACEGGLYIPDRNPSAPIRIYKDRRVQDDIVTAHLGVKWRERMSRSKFRHVKKAAILNRQAGLV